jgi:hypothetical protein
MESWTNCLLYMFESNRGTIKVKLCRIGRKFLTDFNVFSLPRREPSHLPADPFRRRLHPLQGHRPQRPGVDVIKLFSFLTDDEA